MAARLRQSEKTPKRLATPPSVTAGGKITMSKRMLAQERNSCKVFVKPTATPAASTAPAFR
jgi:hypothetical protein